MGRSTTVMAGLNYGSGGFSPIHVATALIPRAWKGSSDCHSKHVGSETFRLMPTGYRVHAR